MATYHVGKISVVDGKHDTVFITRPSLISNQVHTVCIAGLRGGDVAKWLAGRATGTAPLVQDAFPNITPAEREFLMTGITEEEWAKSVAQEEGQEE